MAAIRYLAGIGVVVAFYFAIPLVFRLAGGWWAGFALLLLIVPVVRVVSDALMGHMIASPENLVAAFLHYFTELNLFMFVLALFVPLIALQIIWVFSFMGLAVGLIGAAVAMLQLYGGFDLGASMQYNDLRDMLLLCAGCVAVIAAGFGVTMFLQRHEQSFWDFVRELFRSARARLPRRPGSTDKE